MTLNIKKARVKVLNIVREEYKQVIVDISASMKNMTVRNARIWIVFNCGKLGHFACDCIDTKVMFNHSHPSNLNISNCLMLVEYIPFFYYRIRNN